MNTLIIALLFNFLLVCWPKTNIINYHKENIRKLTLWTAPGSVVFH